MNFRYYEGVRTKRIGYDFYADIAENIVSARRKKGWTQEELAKQSKVRLAKVKGIEEVRTRIYMSELTQIAKALDVTELYLTGESPESKVGECLFTVANERFPDMAIYQKAQSYGLAFLQLHEDTRTRFHVRMFEPRDRAKVTLRGVPVTNTEMAAKFPRAAEKDDQLESEATPCA